jgi:cytochrome c oxidase assembly protein subunit 15
LKRHAILLAAAVSLQAALGIVTLRYAAPLTLSLAHQALAVLVLTIALSLVWRIRRN